MSWPVVLRIFECLVECHPLRPMHWNDASGIRRYRKRNWIISSLTLSGKQKIIPSIHSLTYKKCLWYLYYLLLRFPLQMISPVYIDTTPVLHLIPPVNNVQKAGIMFRKWESSKMPARNHTEPRGLPLVRPPNHTYCPPISEWHPMLYIDAPPQSNAVYSEMTIASWYRKLFIEIENSPVL